MQRDSGTALAVLAHPDDAEFLCGGTLALLALRGWEIHVATSRMRLPPFGEPRGRLQRKSLVDTTTAWSLGTCASSTVKTDSDASPPCCDRCDLI